MKKRNVFLSFIPFYLVIFLAMLLLALGGSRAVTVISENAPRQSAHCIIIDAGHGGVDGGATSCSGVLESNINLEIALRLDDLFHLLGYNTKMVRTTDCSVYTEGETIAQKKISDLKQRVRLVNESENAILISIHQNIFADSQYAGAQVFYTNNAQSRTLAEALQKSLVQTLNPGSKRTCKKAEGIYLMQNIDCTGILLECGFLSNPQEEAKLRDAAYQKKLCCVIASATGNFLDQ